MRFLPLVFCVAACGSRGDLPFDPGPPVNPSPTTGGEAPLYLSAVRGDDVFVVAVRPDTGETTAFGAKLPAPIHGMSPSTVLYADGARAVVVWQYVRVSGGSIDEDSSLVVGGGSGWTELLRAPASIGATSVDAKGLVASRSCNPLDLAAVQSFRAIDLDAPAATLDCPPRDALSDLQRAPGGAYYVARRDDGLFARAPSGAETRVPALPKAAPRTLFASSFLAVTADEAAWFDADGRALVVPGATDDAAAYGPADTTFPVSYQVARGELAAVKDRSIERLQAIPDWVTPRDVGAIAPGHYAVVTRGSDAVLIGLDGAELARFSPGAPYDATEVVAHAFDGPWPWVVLRSTHFEPTVADDVGDLHVKDTLWLTGDPASGRAPRARMLVEGTHDTSRPYLPSSSGRFVLYRTRDGAAHSIEIASQDDIAIGAGYDAVWW